MPRNIKVHAKRTPRLNARRKYEPGDMVLLKGGNGTRTAGLERELAPGLWVVRLWSRTKNRFGSPKTYGEATFVGPADGNLRATRGAYMFWPRRRGLKTFDPPTINTEPRE